MNAQLLKWPLHMALIVTLLSVSACGGKMRDAEMQAREDGKIHLKKDGFLYQSFANDAYAPSAPIAEEARLRAMLYHAEDAGLCPDGYEVVQRYVAKRPHNDLGTPKLHDVYYHARCR